MQSKMSYGNSMLLITPSLYNSCTNLRYDCELVWHISNAGNCQQAILPDRRPGDVTRVRGQSVWKVKQIHLWEVQDERTAALGGAGWAQLWAPPQHRGTQCRLTLSNLCNKSLSMLMRNYFCLRQAGVLWVSPVPSSLHVSLKKEKCLLHQNSCAQQETQFKCKAYQSRGARLCWPAEFYFITMHA